MKIEFIVGHSFIGEHKKLVVNGIYHDIDPTYTGSELVWVKNKTDEEYAVEILKEVYNIDYKIEDVKWIWNGRL